MTSRKVQSETPLKKLKNNPSRQKRQVRFDPSLLGLGDITKEEDSFEALAAIFDLEGFTPFCNQTDPHLVVPKYLKAFLNWIFKGIFEGLIKKENDDEVVLAPLPFYAKFLGDGILFLWKVKGLSIEEKASLVSTLFEICVDYQNRFYPDIRKRVSKAPSVLRCGIARGLITPIGDNKDYVGFCINLAARLQKLEKFSFAFSQKDLDFEQDLHEDWLKYFTLIRISVRGVSREELVYVLKIELAKLSKAKRKQLSL